MTIDALLARREGADFEAKEAQGRDGRGAVPRSVWETYSAMANTQGGDIVLGVKEHPDGSLDVLGLGDPARVVQQFWDGVNNPQTASVNVLRNADVEVVEGDGLAVVHVAVPRARRQQRPVYTGPNIFGGTYRRNNEGDYRCPDPEVRRMIADAEQDQRDARILPGYTLDDLDAPSLAAYRNEFRSANPNHVWLTEDDLGLLTQLGGWRRDRETGDEGLTLAGLLMFGRLRPIFDTLPDFVLDYREVPDDGVGIRWTDRVTTDGTWSGNLYGFYRRVFSRLTDDLRVPFQTDAGRRVEETPVHRALKEALVNALIHADYSASTPTLIVKKRGRFSFRNPGALRIPPERVRAGGTSDSRNRNLQKMFQMIGAAEQAGSGFPTIIGAWRDQHWRPPSLVEWFEPEHVTLRLTTASLLPDDVLLRLVHRFGDQFTDRDETSRLAVATAATEKRVTNGRMQELCNDHPSDITAVFQSLVHDGLLAPHGAKRGKFYTLPPDSEQPSLFSGRDPAESNLALSPSHTAQSTGNSGQRMGNSEQTAGNSGQSPGNSEHRPGNSEQSPGNIERDVYDRLRPFVLAAGDVGRSAWAPASDVQTALLAVLHLAREHDEFLTTADLMVVMNREKGTLLRYLKKLGEHVETRYEGRRAPGQGYRARQPGP